MVDRDGDLSRELDQAIAGGELFLEYQGLFDLARSRPVGVEALLRWRHPTLGVLLPGVFLGHLAGGPLGFRLTRHVADLAIGQCARWQRQGLEIPISINVHPDALIDAAVPTMIGELLAGHAVAPRLLTVEVTEQGCSSPASIRRSVIALARMGVRLSLDDFGLGDSSMLRLQQLHFDELKIDRAFVHHAATEPTDRKIVQWVSALAHSLGIHVVAEGVETAAVLEVCHGLGVDVAQGFHLHRPAAADDIPDLFTGWVDVPSAVRGADRVLRVVIADDQVHFRRGLRLALESSGERIEVVGEASTGRKAVEVVAELRPDVALLDLRMPDGDGIAAAEAILATVLGTQVLMLTVSDDPADIARATEAGAAGYLLKERSLHEVVAAVRSVVSGRTWPLPSR